MESATVLFVQGRVKKRKKSILKRNLTPALWESCVPTHSTPNFVVPLYVTPLLGKGHSLMWQRKSLRLRLLVAAHGQTPNLPALPVWRRCPSCEESSRTGLAP